jgi:uncharacterized protein (DUF2237 family)
MRAGKTTRLSVCRTWYLATCMLVLPILISDAQQCEKPAKGAQMNEKENMPDTKNVLGTSLLQCGCAPITGFFRDGYCRTETRDVGRHTVCAIVTQEFLDFTRGRGNDLSTPAPQFGFPGLKPGDRWCLCVSRWKESLDAGCAPPVILEATHEQALQTVTLEELRSKSLQ